MLFRFNPIFLALVVFFFVLAFLPIMLYAQTPGEFDWASLGVDTFVVGVIISMVQFLKKFLPQKTVAWLPLVFSSVICAVYGIFTNLSGGGVEFLIKMALSYAVASAYIYEIGKTVGLAKLFKGWSMVNKKP